MARMLGRYETPGCCPGSREGKFRHKMGPDCSGALADTRWRKTVERREVRREADRWIHSSPLRLDPLDDPSDCVHGCAGGCDRWGSEVCTWLCHPASLADSVMQWAEQHGHCDPDGEPDWALVAAHLDRYAAMRR